VEVGDAIKAKSLPFVVGVIADLAPTSLEQSAKLKDRSFISVDADNLERVMEGLNPNISISVPNRLGGANNLRVNLNFTNLDSFSPAGVALAVPQLAELLETRAKLNDLLAKLEGNDRLNDLLLEVVSNSEVGAIAMSEVKQLRLAVDSETSSEQSEDA